jgi:S-DNA-T family DNA segregation ATPase FtsK/SpoIIIE
LLWKWDLLFVSPSHKHPIRIQAPYISTEDTETIIQELKNKYIWSLQSEEDIYDKELMDILSWNKPESSYDWSWAWDDEELIQQAIEIIQQTRKASITLLQRRLKIWFARAARLMDQLEERWIVWPQEGSKPREILI